MIKNHRERNKCMKDECVCFQENRVSFPLGPEGNVASRLILEANPPKESIIILPDQELMINKTNYLPVKPTFKCILLEEISVVNVFSNYYQLDSTFQKGVIYSANI